MKPARTVDQQRWQRLEKIWGEVSKLAGPERESFVLREPMDDEERQELLDMLALDRIEDGAGPPSRAIGNALDGTAERRHALINKVIGRYRIVSILGRGGSGTVYLGERADKAYSAQVAVKIIDESAATSFGARFRAERQILASLNHPNIARLLDAGETDTHQPYLVMEYIHGEPVDRYCDNKQLDVRGRLELFLKICSAVQFAHQHLIVHRDIKPANILVTDDGTPKLLDFGIAKLLHATELTIPELTRMNDRVLTPEYASPEQILGNNVTTASDLYSLSVVLYQLLSGLRPYRLSSSAASQLELERLICMGGDPLRPSAAVLAAIRTPPAEADPSIADLSRVRATTPERLARQLAGDLDAIIMRALRKEPSHRYDGSIDQLISDIRRYLSNEPVQARQGNWVYYSQRFIRRNRLPVGASASVVIFLIAMVTVLWIQISEKNRALIEKNRALISEAAVSEFMSGIFEAPDPYKNLGHELTARELLDQAARDVEVDPDLPPEARARVQTLVGNSYRRMGSPSKAVLQLAQAARVEKSLEPRGPRVAATLIALARAEREAGLLEEAAQHFDEAQQIGVTNNAELKAKLLTEKGKLQAASSQVPQARESFTAALQLMRAARGSRDPEVASILSEMASLYTWTDNLTAAEAAAREAVDIYSSKLDPRQPDRVKAEGFLAEILFLQGRVDEAGPIFERVLAAQRQLFGNSSLIGDTLASLAQVRLEQGNAAEAEKLVREALETHRVSGSTAHSKILYLQVLLGTVLLKQCRYDDAATHLSATLESIGKSLPSDHQYVASTEHYLGEALAAIGKLVDAEAHLTAAMNRWKRTDAPAWRSARSESALGEVLHRQGRIAEAETHLTSSYAILVAAPGVDRETREKARERIAKFYSDTHQSSKWEEFMRHIDHDVILQKDRMPL